MIFSCLDEVRDQEKLRDASDNHQIFMRFGNIIEALMELGQDALAMSTLLKLAVHIF